MPAVDDFGIHRAVDDYARCQRGRAGPRHRRDDGNALPWRRRRGAGGYISASPEVCCARCPPECHKKAPAVRLLISCWMPDSPPQEARRTPPEARAQTTARDCERFCSRTRRESAIDQVFLVAQRTDAIDERLGLELSPDCSGPPWPAAAVTEGVTFLQRATSLSWKKGATTRTRAGQ